MRFLANENLPLDMVSALKLAGHDVIWIRTDAPGSSDQQILRRAVLEKRILLTFDKDFGQLAFHARMPSECGIVLFRISAPRSEDVARMALVALSSRQDWQGHFSVIERDRIRMRPLP